MACSHMQGSRVPTSCPSNLFMALAHCLQNSVLLTYGVPQAPLRQYGSHNAHHQQVGAIENA